MEVVPINLMDFITHVGIPSTITLALLVGFWKGAKWVGQEVVIPVRNRHFAFLDTLEKTLKVVTEAQENLTKQMDVITKIVTAPNWNKCKTCPEESRA